MPEETNNTPDITELPEFREAVAAEVEGLKKNREDAVKRLKEAQTKLKQYEGIDPDEYQALMEAREQAEAEKAKAAGDWEKREGTWQKKVSEKDAIIADQDARFRTALKERDAALAIGHHGGNEKLLLDTTLKALKVDDDYSVFAEVNGERLSANDYVASLKNDPDYAGGFPGAGTAGSGSRGSTTTGQTLPDGMTMPAGITIIKSAAD